MSGPSLTQIREGIAVNVATLTGIQVSAYGLANPTPPYLNVVPGPIDYDKAFQRGLDGYMLRAVVMVGDVSDVGAQKTLDAFLAPSGPQSVKEAIESDTTLGGLIDDLRVTRNSGYRQYPTFGQAVSLGSEWEIEVMADGR